MVPKEAASHKKGPGTKSGVFFNPVMEFSRDVSVLFMRVFLRKNKAKLLDGLAGTGARGIRIANEIPGELEMVLNDHNPEAFKVMKRNMKFNGLDEHRVENSNLNTLLSLEGFDYVDIDPYGSPVRFLDPAIQSLSRRGMLAITATDTAPLCGRFISTCERRYDARSIKTQYSKEVGVRILAGHCVRIAAKFDIGLTPILSFFSDHYIRIHLKVEKGAKKADIARENLGYILHNGMSGDRRITSDISEQDSGEEYAGPLWLGDLHDIRFLKKMEEDSNLGSSKKIEKYLPLWKEEAQLPPYFYETNEIASLTKTHPRPLLDIIEGLEDMGYSASRTHFSPSGFKTDCEISKIKKMVSKM
jgi:tRNA (guanine26-N2/guanine27-N2)-dimethyltransferase